jgi:hypothetical protein
VTIPSITPLPTPVPSTADPANFDTRADAFLGALPGMLTEENAAIAAINLTSDDINTMATDIAAVAAVATASTDLVAFSTSNLDVAAGTLTIHFTAPKTGFAADDQVAVILRSDPSIRMYGNVATFDGSDDMTVAVVSSGVFGSGTFASWVIVSTAFLSAGATAAQMWAQTSDAVAATPKANKDANALVALTFGATVTPNLLNGRRFSLSASSSFTLANPTNCSPGDPIEINVTNTAGAIVLAVGTAWKRQNGLFVMDPANGHTNKITGIVETVDGSGNATAITYSGLRNPS